MEHFPIIHYSGNPQQDSTDDVRMNYIVNQRNFTGRIIFMSMFNDILWDAKGNDELCVNNSKTIEEYADRFPPGHWSFLGAWI